MHHTQNRKLAAILFADIVGYTAMMQANENAGLEKLHHYQGILTNLLQKYQGEQVKDMGDGSLCVFSSAVAAVKCARDLQIALREEPSVPLRIGIHLGDIVFEKNNVYGDGVNIASRIEQLSIPGGIFFSESINKAVKSQGDLTIHSLGRFKLKNVEEPAYVYALADKGFPLPGKNALKEQVTTIASRKRTLIFGFLALSALALLFYFLIPTNDVADSTDKSIAILPFENFNKDPEQVYLSDGISQDILTHLSGIKDLQVISFNSSKQYRGSDKSTKEIGTALGAKHLLSGSVQQSGKQLRIRAMLVNTETDQQLWADRYDMKLEDIFQIQSEVSNKIAEVLKAELLPEVAARINQKPTDNIEAFQDYSQGRYLFDQRGRENILKAEEYFLKAIELDSSFALAYAGVAQCYLLLSMPNHDPQMFQKVKRYADKAIAINPETADAYAVLGSYHRWYNCNFSQAISQLKKAIDLEPGNANNRQWLAITYQHQGLVEKARQEIDIARRLDPGSSIHQLMDYQIALSEDKYQETIDNLEKFYVQHPQVGPIAIHLIHYYTQFGEYNKAMAFNYPEIRKEWLIYKEKRQLDELKELKARIAQSYDLPDKERTLYLIENDIVLLSGDLESYVSRIDSSFFILAYDDLQAFQLFPPPDSIRLHPKFQEMIKKRGVTLRSKDGLLKARKDGK